MLWPFQFYILIGLEMARFFSALDVENVEVQHDNYCSFCGTPSDKCARFIESFIPPHHGICGECVKQMRQIVRGNGGFKVDGNVIYICGEPGK
jgi:hypothetical protein